MDIVEIRDEIDAIDDEMVKLLERRFALSLEVAQYKLEHNLTILNTDREKDVLDKVTSEIDPSHEDIIRSLFISIMETSRKLQHEFISSAK